MKKIILLFSFFFLLPACKEGEKGRPGSVFLRLLDIDNVTLVDENLTTAIPGVPHILHPVMSQEFEVKTKPGIYRVVYTSSIGRIVDQTIQIEANQGEKGQDSNILTGGRESIAGVQGRSKHYRVQLGLREISIVSVDGDKI